MWNNPLPGVPSVESPFFDQIAQAEGWDEETLRVARDLRDKGYAIIDFPTEDIDALAAGIVGELTPRYDFEGWRREGHGKREGLRVQDAWQTSALVRGVAAEPRILDLLSRLYGRRAFPFQTLNFPVGTQQDAHSDSMHFSSVPERFMCGVWLALEDIDADNGSLEYYPGSHKLPIYTNEHIGVCAAVSKNKVAHYKAYLSLWQRLAEAHGLEKETFHARKGQALIWSANLLHGGGVHLDLQRTRWSQVTHYYFEGCSYYTPLTSDPFFGSIEYRKLTDIATGEPRENMYAGLKVPEETVDRALYNMDAYAFSAEDRPLPLGFSASDYLVANPDVAAAGVDAAEHWRAFGYAEGRKLRAGSP
ncbi:phytanoyl-CoA dioxygenase family protein [Luteimonas sp. MJ246]|uniref:phytanoyl-CoA dioxygenase family protein n=1 Tax=Luteimonas sp. MJ174 TaxID=3129237 RepID=UPI0031BBBBB4